MRYSSSGDSRSMVGRAGLARVARADAHDLSVVPTPSHRVGLRRTLVLIPRQRAVTCEAWWAGRDSNPQPKHYECSALTIELPARASPRFNRVAGASRKLHNHRAHVLCAASNFEAGCRRIGSSELFIELPTSSSGSELFVEGQQPRMRGLEGWSWGVVEQGDK